MNVHGSYRDVGVNVVVDVVNIVVDNLCIVDIIVVIAVVAIYGDNVADSDVIGIVRRLKF